VQLLLVEVGTSARQVLSYAEELLSEPARAELRSGSARSWTGGNVTFALVCSSHLRPVKVERSPGHLVVVRYSWAMTPADVLSRAMHKLTDAETVELASVLGFREVG